MTDSSSRSESPIRPLIAALPLILVLGLVAVMAIAQTVSGGAIWGVFAASFICGLTVFAFGLKWWLLLCGLFAIQGIAMLAGASPSPFADDLDGDRVFDAAGSLVGGAVAGSVLGLSVPIVSSIWRINRGDSGMKKEDSTRKMAGE